MKNKMKIAVDLLWVKHGLVGGIETYVLNLLDGISQADHLNNYILIVSKDNKHIFERFCSSGNFSLHICNEVISTNVLKTVLWENIHLDKIVSMLNADFCFVPYYRKPCLNARNKYVIVLHDMQSLHFPEYFSKAKCLWLKFYWKLSLNSATRIVAISKFVKLDIMKWYNISDEKIDVVYNPIVISPFRDYRCTLSKYNLEENRYFYTISSLLKHKNLITILKAILLLKNEGKEVRLVITGIKGSSTNEVSDFISNNNLQSNCVYTGYISDEEKFDLLRGCRLFLFPSIFEGFGMPPIESLLVGKQVITTKCTCIPEVTENMAIYVNNPFDYYEWANKMRQSYEPVRQDIINRLRTKYSPFVIAKKYIEIFNKL